MVRCFRVIYSLVFCLACSCIFAAPAQLPNVLSIDELKSALSREQVKIKSIYFDYRSDDAYVEDKAFPSGTYLRRIVAAKGPNLFSHETAHGSDQLPWEKDPRRRHCIVENNQVFDYWVTNRAYNKTPRWKPNAPLPGSMPGEPIIQDTGIWPLTARKAPTRDGHPIMLCDVAKSDKFSVRPELETVDGHECHVLENPSIDCLWLDVERGCALLARNLYGVKTGRLSTRLELSDYQEVKPGIWIPSVVRDIKYDHLADDPNKRNRVISDLSLHVTSIRVNDVPDSMFVFQPKPGSLWLNPPKEKSLSPLQTHPGGTDHLDALIAWAKAILPEQIPPTFPWLTWLMAGLAGLGTFFLAESVIQTHATNTISKQ